MVSFCLYPQFVKDFLTGIMFTFFWSSSLSLLAMLSLKSADIHSFHVRFFLQIFINASTSKLQFSNQTEEATGLLLLFMSQLGDSPATQAL